MVVVVVSTGGWPPWAERVIVCPHVDVVIGVVEIGGGRVVAEKQ